MPAEDLLAPGRPRQSRRASLGGPFTAFVVSALLVLAAVATAAVLISAHIARSTAVAEAERIAVRLADLLVAPLLRDALAGDETKWAELERDLDRRMSDGSVVSVLVWSDEGEVVWSTIDELVGQRPGVGEDLAAALAGDVVAHVDDSPETAYEGITGPLLEVYAPVDVPERMVVETYLPTDGIERQTSLLRGEIVPVAVGALVVLQLVQLPIAASMARRARRHEEERLELMARTLKASDRERRAIAGDVHDGPVQDLAGVSYALAGLRSVVPEERQKTVDRLTTTIRHAVASLRRLMVDIYPPDLSGPGLAAALDDLAVRLRERGTEVTVDAEALPGLRPEYAAVLYRTAKEALTNVARHAEASHVWVRLSRTDNGHGDAALLTVADDGVGLRAPEDAEPDGGSADGDGHFGLRLVRERLADLDGEVQVEPRAGGGTVLTAVLPLPTGD
ncbi:MULTISPECIES: sensor histidine kinase [unclassified Blastococcus]